LTTVWSRPCSSKHPANLKSARLKRCYVHFKRLLN
jgi:hypothetical protein